MCFTSILLNFMWFYILLWLIITSEATQQFIIQMSLTLTRCNIKVIKWHIKASGIIIQQYNMYDSVKRTILHEYSHFWYFIHVEFNLQLSIFTPKFCYFLWCKRSEHCYLSTNSRYLYFSRCNVAVYWCSTTSQRQILYLWLHYICLTALVTFQIG